MTGALSVTSPRVCLKVCKNICLWLVNVFTLSHGNWQNLTDLKLEWGSCRSKFGFQRTFYLQLLFSLFSAISVRWCKPFFFRTVQQLASQSFAFLTYSRTIKSLLTRVMQQTKVLQSYLETSMVIFNYHVPINCYIYYNYYWNLSYIRTNICTVSSGFFVVSACHSEEGATRDRQKVEGFHCFC